MKIRILIILSLLIMVVNAHSQYSQYKGKSDTLEYPYFFPLLGDRAVEEGFDIPYPLGVMVNSFWGRQNMLIDNIGVGFNFPEKEIPITDISEFVGFESVLADVYSITVRPDIWIFPFLDVYAIFGKSFASTYVKLNSPVTLETTAELKGLTYGAGTTGAFGLGNYFTVFDGNWVWSNMEQFDKPVQTSTFSFRFGRAFSVGKNPESNVAFWIGAMRLRLNNDTSGKLRFDELLGEEAWERRDEIVEEYRIWYNDINPIREPVKYRVATEVFNPIVDKIEAGDGSSEVFYVLDKKPVGEWNMLIGGQYQLNKHWQLRAEAGVLGDRASLLASLNYRFGIRGGNRIYQKLLNE